MHIPSSPRHGLTCIFFFHLFENLALRRKGLCAGVFHFQMFVHRAFCLPPTFQSPIVSFIRNVFHLKFE